MSRPLAFGIHLISRGAGDPATTPFPSHTVMLRDAMHVEHLGFDAIWLPDHFYFERAAPDGLQTYPDVWTLLTAIAMRTERVALGTNVLAATFRHPALVAKMAGALQELSNGRLILGLGAGNQPKEHAAFGFDFEHRIGRFKEYAPVLTALLNGETVTLQGRYFTLNEASLRTVVYPVPLWIAAGGQQMLNLTARFATGWNIAGGGLNPTAIQQQYSAFASACRAVSRDITDFDVCKMTFMGVAADATCAQRMRVEVAAKLNTTPDALARRTLIGTPDEIAAWLSTLTDIGVNHHICQVIESDQWPNYLDSLELLAREVIPRVRNQP